MKPTPSGDSSAGSDPGYGRRRGDSSAGSGGERGRRRPQGRERAPRARRERRYFRFTREGKAFVGVTFGVGIAAVNTGNNLLYLVLGLMLSTLLLSGVLSELALRGVRVRRRLPARAFAHSPCLVELTVRNTKRHLPSFSLDVEDRVGGAPAERRCYFLKVRAQGEQTASYRRVPGRRGRLHLEGLRLGTRYPFGLVEKVRVIERPAEMLVYPALLPSEERAVQLGSEHAENPTGALGPGREVAGVREYHEGDEARSIHWRRTAALGRLVVREHEREATSRHTLLIDNGQPVDAGVDWHDELEQAVSRAATLAADALARGAAVEVRARTGASPVVPPGSPPDPIWRFLALLEPVPLDADAPSAPHGAGRQVHHLGPHAARPSTPAGSL